jgi:hypothetical protein
MVTEITASYPSHFDGLVEDSLCGWIWTGLPDGERLNVSFFDGENLIGETIADNFREDLQKAGIGDGYHSFKWKLPEKFYDGKEHVFRAINFVTGLDLAFSPSSYKLKKVLPSDMTSEQWLERLEALSFPAVAAAVKIEDALAYLYIILLGRDIDECGLKNCSSKLTILEIANEILHSEEFKKKINKKLIKPEDVIVIYNEWKTLYSCQFKSKQDNKNS